MFINKGTTTPSTINPRVPMRTMPLKVTPDGKVVPFLLNRRPLRMTYLQSLRHIVEGIGPVFSMCQPCFGKRCAELHCDWKDRV